MDYAKLFPSSTPITGVAGAFLGIVLVWSIIWKGLALWKAARRNDSGWFIALMILNTVGILEIIYYFFISKEKTEQKD
jgi:methionyl-tRNA synthetase